MTFQEVWAELEAKDESFKRAREIAELGVEQLEYTYNQGYKQGKSERPHGKWIEHYDSSDGFTWLTCSRCMFKAYEEDYNFCPNCGADMRGGKE